MAVERASYLNSSLDHVVIGFGDSETMSQMRLYEKHCYNCSSPDRICNALTIYCKQMNDVDDVEIVLIDENLGF